MAELRWLSWKKTALGTEGEICGSGSGDSMLQRAFWERADYAASPVDRIARQRRDN